MIPDTAQSDKDEIERDAVFIEQYRRTGDAVVACVRAGIRDTRYPIQVIADRTLARPEIQSALKSMAMIETSTQSFEVTRASIMADMEEIYQRAVTDSQYSSAISAKKLQAFLAGLMDQKVHITSNINVTHMSTDQLMRIVDNGVPEIARDRQLPMIDVEDE